MTEPKTRPQPLTRRELFDTIAIVLVVGGLGLFFVLQPYLRFDYRSAKASVDWPVTRGVVLRSNLNADRYGKGDAGASYTEYEVFVSYRYNVDGQTLLGSNVHYRHSHFGSSSRAEADAVFRRYAAGNEIDVRYNPAEPADAVLIPGTDHINRGGRWRLGGLFLALALGVAVKDFGRWLRYRRSTAAGLGR